MRSVGTSRGKSRELDQFDAGQFSVVLDNRTRAFDPLYTSSPFYSLLKLRQIVYITTNAVYGSPNILTGYITNWDLSYDVNGDSIATILTITVLR